ncbi:hypothetical protein B0H13DRAFT_804404 [Mycena leptocephala]|nr:hypothetical protein B0H13DRAFT_804404 [Mycena leptocephala]
MDSLWQYQPRSLKLGQIYTSTSLLASFHGYGSPPIDIGQPYALPPNLIRRHSRTVVVNERCFEIWSPNSKQDPYFPGPLAQVDEWGSSLRPVSEGRWDGQLGPCDPTISPQYYNSWEPWQAFIARKLPDLYSTTDDPDITFRPVYDVWCTTCDSYTGKIDPTYIQTLKARHEALDQQIHQRKQLQSGRLRRDMQNASTFFPLSDLEELKRITRYADAVVKVRRLQRLLLKKQAWVDMARAWDQSGNLTIETLRSRSPIPADESRMGLWMNGSSISEHDFLWLLTQTDVPCFFIEESTTLPCHALRSFVAGTPIQGLMASCLYDELARNAGGDVVEVVCPEPPIETKSPPTQNPGTV